MKMDKPNFIFNKKIMKSPKKPSKKKIILNWNNIEEVKPKPFADIVVVTSVGKMKGSYMSGDKIRSRTGIFSFTKWLPK